MNSYAYTQNHKVLNRRPNETGINTCNWRNKDTCPLTNICQMKCVNYRGNTNCDIAAYKQKFSLGSCGTTFKDCFGNHKKSSTTLNIKIIRNYQKNFGKPKSILEQ